MDSALENQYLKEKYIQSLSFTYLSLFSTVLVFSLRTLFFSNSVWYGILPDEEFHESS